MKPHYIILSPYHIPIVYHHFLVGGLNPSEKYEFVSWDHDIPNIGIMTFPTYGKS